MDRKIVYPGQIPLETDLLGTNQNAMVAVGKLAAAIFGTGGAVNGLTVSPNTPAALNVVVAPGEIYQLQNLEATAYSSLPADAAHTLVKQGILLDASTQPCPAPTTAGFSINYLIEATYADSDTAATTLPYYNASNPTQAYSGPNNTGAQQATTRAGVVQLQVKAGVAATTGTQTTPAVDAGYIALAVVTVANGQSSIVAGNIAAVSSGQVLNGPVTSGRLLNVQRFVANGTYMPTPGTNSIIVEGVGGGGGGGACPSTSGTQQAMAFGGQGAAYAMARFTAGFSGGLPVTIGAAGTGGATGANPGNPGGATTLGSILSIPGGLGGSNGTASASTAGVFPNTVGVTDPTVTGGTLIKSQRSMSGVPGIVLALITLRGGAGGDTPFGHGAAAAAAPSAGLTGSGYGAGGGGAAQTNNNAGQSGGNGTGGALVIYEFS